LIAPVDVVHDASGVVHISAQSEHDLFYAQGAVAAQHRLWQMEFFRRIGSGRVSEIVGNATLNIDREFRMLGIRRASQAVVGGGTLSEQTRSVMQAYCDGLNDYVQSGAALPLEFRVLGVTREQIDPFTPVDIVQWAKMMSFDLSENLGYELRRFTLHHDRNVSWARIDELYAPMASDFQTIIDADV
jgi:penicillin amidase